MASLLREGGFGANVLAFMTEHGLKYLDDIVQKVASDERGTSPETFGLRQQPHKVKRIHRCRLKVILSFTSAIRKAGNFWTDNSDRINIPRISKSAKAPSISLPSDTGVSISAGLRLKMRKRARRSSVPINHEATLALSTASRATLLDPDALRLHENPVQTIFVEAETPGQG